MVDSRISINYFREITGDWFFGLRAFFASLNEEKIWKGAALLAFEKGELVRRKNKRCVDDFAKKDRDVKTLLRNGFWCEAVWKSQRAKILNSAEFRYLSGF